jgi:hypothetical protein
MTQTEDEGWRTVARARIIAQGPCGICGGPYAAHRMIDTQMGCVAAGDAPERVAADYDTTVDAMVETWMGYIDLLDRPPTAAELPPTTNYRRCDDPDCDVGWAFKPDESHFHYVGPKEAPDARPVD